MKQRSIIIALIIVALPLAVYAKKVVKQPLSDREYWVQQAWRMAAPVLEPMSRGALSTEMQIEVSPSFDSRDKRVTYMECFGRLMAGLSPWLSLPDDDTAEGKQRRQSKQWALKRLVHQVLLQL